MALLACAVAGPGLRAAEATADQDGIVAEMRVAADGLKLGWRFVRTPPAPIESVSLTADERPLPAPDGPVAAFPAPGQTAVVEVLSESDDRSAPHLGLADAASKLPEGVTVRTASFKLAPGEAGAVSLARDIDRALNDLEAETADRRALLLCAAGPDLAGEPVLAAAARAGRRDIPIFVVPGDAASDADREAAARLARAARGSVLDGRGDLASQVAYTALSGAELSFPFQVQPRLPWQSRAVAVRARIAYGGRVLDLSEVLERPPADRAQAGAAIWEAVRTPLPGFLAGAGSILLVGSLIRAGMVLTRGGRT